MIKKQEEQDGKLKMYYICTKKIGRHFFLLLIILIIIMEGKTYLTADLDSNTDKW